MNVNITQIFEHDISWVLGGEGMICILFITRNYYGYKNWFNRLG